MYKCLSKYVTTLEQYMQEKKRKIICANQSSGSLMLDIVNVFAHSKRFDKVSLITGEINIRPTEPHDDIRIYKTVKYNRKNGLTRLLTWIISFAHLFFLVLIKGKEHELFLVSNPPLNTFIPLFMKRKYYLLIYDIYPDTFVYQEIFDKKSWVVRQWSRANKKLFNEAAQVFTISDSMKEVLQQYTDSEKIKVIYNWIHPIVPVPKSKNNFLKSMNLSNSFIVLYSGNMGITHDLDALVGVAELLKDFQDIRFLFIGEGGKKKIILKEIKESKLDNCIVLSYQPNEMLPQTIGSANIGIVTLDSGSSGLSIPSKTNRFLAMGIPLLCIANHNSELSKLIDSNQVGRSFTKGAQKDMASFILEMKKNSDLYQKYKQNALKLAKKYTPKNAEVFLDHIG